MLTSDIEILSLEVTMNTTIPAELLTLKKRFDDWRANRKYIRESIPDELRSAVLEMIRRYPPSLVHRVLKVDPSRLKKKPLTERCAPRGAAPKKKPQPPRPTRSAVPSQKATRSTRAEVTTLPQPAFFKLPAVAALPVDSSSAQTPAPCRLQLERPDGSRLTLTLPTFDSLTINQLVADFLRGSDQ
jgi:hypothetical protein